MSDKTRIEKELRELHVCDTLEEAQAFAKELGMTVEELLEDSRLEHQARKERLCFECFKKGKREPILEFCHYWSGMQMVTRCCERHYKRIRRWERDLDMHAKLLEIRDQRKTGSSA